MRKSDVQFWAVLISIMVFIVCLHFILKHAHNTVKAQPTQLVEVPCSEIQQSYSDVLYRVWIDNPSYVEDVLNETDEWCKLFDLIGESILDYKFKSIEDSLMYESNLTGSITYDPTCINWVYIPDSTYRKLRKVFPDLPAEQSRPDKQPTKVVDYYEQ